MIEQLTGKENTKLPQEEGAYIAKARPEASFRTSSSKRTEAGWYKNRSKRPTIFYLPNQ
jgi:hypothetical protein